MAGKGRELWEKYKKERKSPSGEERIATGSNATLAMTGRGRNTEIDVTSTGNTARDKWNQLKVNRTLPKAAAAQERARTVYSPQTGAYPAQQLLAQKDRQVAAQMAQDIQDPAGAADRAVARRKQQLVYTDTDALDREIRELEQQRGSYDDAFLTWMTGYEMNPGAWDPEEFADNIARYQQLKDTHGSITELDQQIKSKKKTRRDAEKAKEEHAVYLQQLGYQRKYAGMSYTQLQQAMAGLDEASEEYKWLSQYAPTVMTAQDHRDVFLQAKSDRAALDAEREIYDDAFFTWATGYEMNPGAWDPEEYADNIAKYDQLKKTHGSIGAAAAHYNQEEQQLNDKWWMLERNAKYAALEENTDYEEMSKVSTDKRTTGIGIGVRDLWLGVGDPKYDYINNLGNARSVKDIDDGTYQQYDYMTEKEISDYNYLYNTQGKAAADDYLEYLEYKLNSRVAEKLAEAAQESAETHPFWSSVVSVPLNLAAGGGYMDVALQKLQNAMSGENKPIDYNRPAMGASVGASTIRQTVSQNIADKYGMIEMDEKQHPVLSKIFNGKSLGDVYQLGMSMADSGAVALLSPVLGSAGVALLGGSAATQGMLDAVENGASDEQALTMGLLNGAAEIVFENISLKSLLNGPADSLIKTILNQGFEEGREELLTSLANNLADAVIMAEKSGYTRKVEQYKAQGLTEGQAVAKALTDMAIDMGWDFVGGMFTGGIMGGGSYAGSKVGQAVSDKLYELAKQMYSVEEQGNATGDNPSVTAHDGDSSLYTREPMGAETENTAQTDGVKYSIRNTSQMSLKEQLSKFYGNKLKSSDAFYLGETPAVLEKAGAKVAPLVMTTSSFKKSVTDKHNIPRRVMNKLSENLQKPILSFGVNGETGVLIDDIDGDGKPVLVAIHADQIMDNEKVNNVKSIYGLDNPGSWIQNQIDSGKHLEVYDEEKANAFLRSYGYQALQEDGVRSVTRIADPRRNVNKNPSASTGKVLLQGNQGHTFEVELESVASAGDGKLVMNLQGGGSADVSNMSFPNTGMQLLYQTVAKIADSTEAAQQLLDGIKFVEGSAQNFALGIGQVYLYGKLQMPLEEAVRSSNAVRQLDAELRSSIYEMGQRAGQEQAAKAQQSAAEKNAGKERKGGVHYGYNGQAIDKKKLSPAQRVAVDFAERLAKRKGMTFYFYRSQVNEKGVRVYRDRNGKIVEADNGFYDPSDGSIHIDLNCDNFGDTILFTLAHELTHFIQDTNPEGYRRLCEILTRGYMGMNQSMDQLVKNKQAEYRSKGKNLSYEEAYDEVIAASMESILADGRVLELLDELETKDKSLLEQIRSFIEDTARLLKEIIDTYRGKRPTSPEGRIVMRMNTLYEQLQEAFAQSLHEGGENYRQGGQTNTTPEGGRKWSKNAYNEETSRIKEQIENSAKELDSMEVVADLLVPEDLPSKEAAASWAIQILKPTGYRVDRQGFGVILFNENDIKYGAKYADTPTEKAAFAALPRVLKRGIEIARHNDHKQRSKQTVTFAAPVLINGTRVNVAVVVNLRGNHYMVHRIVLPDGSVFKFGQEKQNDATQELHRGVPNTGSLADATSVASTKTVAQNGAGVKKNSIRYQVNQAAQEHLQEQNAELVEDMEGLQTLVAAQRSANRGRIKAEALGAAASHLMKTAGAKGNQMELIRLLDNYYRYIGQSSAVSWEGMQEHGQPVVDWLMDHTVRSKQISDYARDILDHLRGSRIYLDDTQRGEVAHLYGSFGAYRNMMMGSVTIANERSVSLDTKWQELADMYPDVFDADTNAADMPEALLTAVQRLRTSDTSELEYEYNREFIQQDLMSRVYDSYWSASTLYSVADHYEKQIKELKAKHRQRMGSVYLRHQTAEQQLRSQFKQRQENIQSYYEEKAQRREAEYRESRAKAVESRNRTEMRRKIRKEVESLRSLLEKAPKDRRVKEELQEFVNDAIKAADLVFLENYNEYNMVRNGVGIDLRGNEQQLLQECKQLLDQLDQIREEQEGNEPPESSMHQKWDPDRALQRDAREEAVKRELSKKMAILRDAGVFEEEYKRINDVDAEQLIDSLLKSYEKLKDTETEYLQGAYQENIVKKLNEVKNNIGAKALRDMTLPELEQLHELYHAVAHVVRTANETFATEKARQISELGETVISQLETEGKELLPALKEKLKELGIANLKPETVFELIGSDTLQELMQGLYKGEDTYAMDIEEARIFAQEQGKKYGRKNWDMEKVFSFAGTKITLGQAMGLYAYSKRKQAQGHLEGDGFTGSKNVRIKEKSEKIPVEMNYIMNATKTHTVSKPMYDDLGKLLTPEQKKYVDAMQDYLTKVMGAKGNEVSDKLYGLKLFKEDAYFPLKTASEYHDEVLGGTMGEAKLKNTGFTKEVQKGASNPIVLDDFESVWAAHVDKMSLYHGMTLPMEDFERVYNYHRTAQEGVADSSGEVYKTKERKTKETVKVHIQNRMGEAANKYITTLMQQVNGGIRGDSTEKMFSGMVRNFKKTAVLGSLSVTVQQPTAFARAMAYLDVADVADWKNWLGKSGKPETTLVAEMYKYAPVALMKRIGGFDPGLGRTSQEYLFGNDGSILAKLDDVLSLGPEKADEMTWAYIWVCTKRQIHRQNPNMSVRSEAFLKKAGDRFSQIIRSTQVYDSVLVKSQYMRSPNIFMKMATSFMNEPTTSLDMYINATIKASRGKISKKTAARTYGSVFCSQIMAAAAAAFVYALRDDDEDESYWEKYISSFVGKGLENILPWYNVPFVKDVISAFEGYTVERSDMSVFVDIYQAWKKLQSDKASPWEKVESFAGSVLNLFGIPLKNVSRDVRGIYRAISTIWGTDEQVTTGAGLKVALMEGLTGQKASNPDQLVKAVKNNDATQILRVMARYSSEQSACTAVSNAVKENLLDNVITEKKALKFLQVYAGKSREEALEKITWWQFQAAHPDSGLTETAAVTWQTELKDTGISLEVYTEYKGKVKNDTLKEDALKIINSLPLTRKQKDALYLQEYAASKLNEAPWN